MIRLKNTAEVLSSILININNVENVKNLRLTYTMIISGKYTLKLLTELRLPIDSRILKEHHYYYF